MIGGGGAGVATGPGAGGGLVAMTGLGIGGDMKIGSGCISTGGRSCLTTDSMSEMTDAVRTSELATPGRPSKDISRTVACGVA